MNVFAILEAKKAFQGILNMFLFSERDQVTHTQIYRTSIIWIFRELQYIEEICKIN